MAPRSAAKGESPDLAVTPWLLLPASGVGDSAIRAVRSRWCRPRQTRTTRGRTVPHELERVGNALLRALVDVDREPRCGNDRARARYEPDMGRARDRFDPTSPFAMRPALVLLAAAVAVGICGFLVFAYFGSRPHDLLIPVDVASGEPAAFGIYVTSGGYGKVDPATGIVTNGSVFNRTWPYGILVAAWDDGRVVWSVGERPEDGEVAWTTTSPEVVASARARLVEAMDDPTRPSEPPFVHSDAPATVAFVRDDGRYQSIWCQTWQVEPMVEDEADLGPFREKWAACRKVALEVVPKKSTKQKVEWIRFQQEDK